VQVTARLARPLSRQDREALEEAAARFGSFFGSTVDVTLQE
jgi:hypothetical protein